MLIAAEEKYGTPILRDLCAAMGNRIHHDKMPIDPEFDTDSLAHP